MGSNCIDDVRDSFGEPNISPRTGDEYQPELPQILGVSDYMSNSRNYMDTEAKSHSYENFVVGLPIPLTRIGSLKQDGPEIIPDIKQTDPKNLPNHESQSLSVEEKTQKCRGVLVPGLLGESWSDAEKASFLLGLYIFEKNFVYVRRFVETRKMGDILSYYYEKFYSSADYVRWSEQRKTKGKKYVIGQGVFSGLRRQELLSRLVPRVSEESRSALLEVSKTFSDEKMSLLDYLSSLKAVVGIKTLVDAIGIGKGKKDLTRMALEPSRSNQAIPARQKIPIGKAWASLRTSDIIKFLHGGYRLGKAQSNDLFWEAVWPRLLARGWHLEQPDSEGYNGPKQSLVFLMPGVEKFSRTELVKVDHYFDSVTDVLGRVAKEPCLIELENEEVECESTSSENKSEENRNDQRQFYLRPGRKQKQGNDVDCKAPMSKRCRRLSAGNHEETGPRSDNGPSCQSSDVNNFNEDLSSVPSSVRDKLSSSAGQSKGSQSEKAKCDPISDARPTEPRTRLSIDLNSSPQVSQESEQDNQSITPNSNNEGRNEQRCVVNPNPNPPRHSTRIRPLTAKALEAIADGYSKANRKRRGKITSSQEGVASRPSQRARGGVR